MGLIAVLSATSLVVSANAGAQEEDPPDFSATDLTPTDRVTGGKALTSGLAETDPALLGRTDATPVDVVVKLDYDSVATYQGSVQGLDATSPSVTGEALDTTSAAVQEYDSFIAEKEDAFLDQLAEVVPDAQVGQSLRTVYGGVALTIPANTVADVLAIREVVAVQSDTLNQPTTDSSGEWIGATSVYPELGGTRQAGSGVVFGVLDTGAWPEHPSFADQGNLGAPPPKADGTPRTCNFGDNPLTPANDPFACTNKLIGGAPFLATYLSDPGRAAAEPYHTARDSNGHGTHTGSTAAGNALDSAEVFGVERGPLAGIAPGAWVSVYKVCGIEGCFDSDSAAAVGQAVKDGVKVINFSISGGTDPFTDPVELAFLDAYAAGVFVAASAGNDGPGAGTVNHVSPWTTTVAASTQQREFRSTLTVTADNGDTFETFGASITDGVDPALPVVLSSDAPYSNNLCTAPAAPGTFTGKIVACQRGGNARVEKGFNVLQGGAAGMILYNAALADIETDNHWLPTVHLADGTDFKAFMTGHTGETATFTAGEKADGQGDVLAAFSSKGPGGNFIKPDITAPGVQILAGHTPTPESVVEGPPGEFFQAIAGTSMSSPHIAGSAILLADLNPALTPGQIKSALMTTANWADQKKEDGVTQAGPFDVGAGRVELTFAPDAGLAISATAAQYALSANDPNAAIDLNVPSVYVPKLAGSITTSRIVTNVTDRQVRYDVTTLAPQGTTIKVTPRRVNLAPGDSAELSITIDTRETKGDFDGMIFLDPRTNGLAQQHLPVAFTAAQGDVTLTQTCMPNMIIVRDETSTCTVIAQNQSSEDTTVDLTTRLDRELRIVDVDGTNQTGNRSTHVVADLNGKEAGVPSVDPGELFGYIPLDAFGVPTTPIGDEEIANFGVPAFVYNGVSYGAIGVDSNGYVVAGGGSSTDNNCCNLPTGPDPAPPNNMLAPFWTDLDGTNVASTPVAEGILVAVLTDGVNSWLVVEWRVNVFGTTSNRTFQVWVGIDGTQDITFAYPGPLGAPGTQDFLVGAENENGEGDVVAVLPTADLRVTSTDPIPGGSKTYTVTARGREVGFPVVETSMLSPAVAGTTVVESVITVIE